MDTLVNSTKSGQKIYLTDFGTEGYALISAISKNIATELQKKGMTICKSYWCLTSYHIDGQLHHWLNGTLDINMLNALERFTHLKHPKLEIKELSRDHWTAIEATNRFGVPASHEVWQSDEIPAHENLKPNLTIYDHRESELLRIVRLQEGDTPRPGFKALPKQLSFSLGS